MLKQGKAVSMPVIVLALLIVIAVMGGVAWKLFAPPPEPMAGLTVDQKAEKIRQAREHMSKAGELAAPIKP